KGGKLNRPAPGPVIAGQPAAPWAHDEAYQLAVGPPPQLVIAERQRRHPVLDRQLRAVLEGQIPRASERQGLAGADDAHGKPAERAAAFAATSAECRADRLDRRARCVVPAV